LWWEYHNCLRRGSAGPCGPRWVGHVTHMNGLCHTYEWVMAHIWMSHVTHMNASCHTYERVMSHISKRIGHFTHMDGKYHKYDRHRNELRMSYEGHDTWMSHVPRRSGQCHTYEWLMISIWMRHVNEPCHTFERVISNLRISPGTDPTRYWAAKTHMMPYLYRPFSAKEPYN